MEKILIDCIGEPFAHGHGYVAFSRASDCLNVSALVTESQLHETSVEGKMMPVITNIVYRVIFQYL
jgi:hypothetical protein